MGATPSQIENEVADPDSESDDDEVIKIQHHRRYRVSLHFFHCECREICRNLQTILCTCFHYATTIS